jgi:hypothetical protein
MDIFYSLAVTAALFSILILLSITWLVITISQTHAEYQHIPGPERARYVGKKYRNLLFTISVIGYSDPWVHCMRFF